MPGSMTGSSGPFVPGITTCWVVVSSRLGACVSAGRARASARFGELLRQHRLVSGLSQEELAERAGLAVRTIANMERGRTARPHRRSVRSLARALALSELQREQLDRASRIQAGLGFGADVVPTGWSPGCSHRHRAPPAPGRRPRLHRTVTRTPAPLTACSTAAKRRGASHLGDRGHRRGRQDRACRALGAPGRRPVPRRPALREPARLRPRPAGHGQRRPGRLPARTRRARPGDPARAPMSGRRFTAPCWPGGGC